MSGSVHPYWYQRTDQAPRVGRAGWLHDAGSPVYGEVSMAGACGPGRLRVMKTLLAAIVLSVVGCTPSIAGFEVGERGCEPGSRVLGPGDLGSCFGYRTLAEQYVNEDEPSHPPVSAIEVYANVPAIGTNSGAATAAIVAIRLADGTVRAYRISCGAGASVDICIDRDGHTHPARAPLP
jgi:hypothetical protein